MSETSEIRLAKGVEPLPIRSEDAPGRQVCRVHLPCALDYLGNALACTLLGLRVYTPGQNARGRVRTVSVHARPMRENKCARQEDGR